MCVCVCVPVFNYPACFPKWCRVRGRRRGRRLPWRRRARIRRRRRPIALAASHQRHPSANMEHNNTSTTTTVAQQIAKGRPAPEINRHLENLTKEQPGSLSKGRTSRILVGIRQRATPLLTSPQLRGLMKRVTFFYYLSLHSRGDHPWQLMFNPTWNDNNK